MRYGAWGSLGHEGHASTGPKVALAQQVDPTRKEFSNGSFTVKKWNTGSFKIN
jgi:hypothetical protein